MGNGLQGGGALIGKPHAHKEPSLLQAGKKREARGDILLLQNSWPGWGLGAGLPWWRLGGAWEWGYPGGDWAGPGSGATLAETGRGLGGRLPYITSGGDWTGPGGGATPIPQVAEIGWGLGVGLLLYHKWQRLGGAWGWG